MPAQSQTTLLENLKTATDPDKRRTLALALLARSNSRQMVDESLRALTKLDLTAEDRPVLRQKAIYYLDHAAKDSGGLLREKLLRLLIGIGSTEDTDLFRAGVWVYDRKPVTDTAQTCRATALVGLAGVNPTQAGIHAARLLGEPDTSPLSGEPSLTAIGVLARLNERLAIYQFALRQGEDFIRRGNGEVVGRALEMLGADFPADVFTALVEPLLAFDAPAASAGVINYIVESRQAALYPLLNKVLDDTRDEDLHHFGLVTLAAARDDDLTRLLYDRAEICSQGDVRAMIEAVELTAHPEREAVLAVLERRL